MIFIGPALVQQHDLPVLGVPRLSRDILAQPFQRKGANRPSELECEYIAHVGRFRERRIPFGFRTYPDVAQFEDDKFVRWLGGDKPATKPKFDDE